MEKTMEISELLLKIYTELQAKKENMFIAHTIKFNPEAFALLENLDPVKGLEVDVGPLKLWKNKNKIINVEIKNIRMDAIHDLPEYLHTLGNTMNRLAFSWNCALGEVTLTGWVTYKNTHLHFYTLMIKKIRQIYGL
jgi:hypothetical protein